MMRLLFILAVVTITLHVTPEAHQDALMEEAMRSPVSYSQDKSIVSGLLEKTSDG